MVANPKQAPEPRPSWIEEALALPGGDDIIVLEGATWADFERIIAIRGERQFPRLAFLAGSLQLMTPTRYHEAIKSMIGCLIEAWCFESDVDITPYGGWLVKEAALERGLEPDECYVVGDFRGEDSELVRPDLAIEVVWTSGGIDKLAIYAGLRVPEVWYWRKGIITLFELRDGAYTEIPTSGLLPGIDHAELATYLAVRPMTRAARAYREALRRRAGEGA